MSLYTVTDRLDNEISVTADYVMAESDGFVKFYRQHVGTKKDELIAMFDKPPSVVKEEEIEE